MFKLILVSALFFNGGYKLTETDFSRTVIGNFETLQLCNDAGNDLTGNLVGERIEIWNSTKVRIWGTETYDCVQLKD